MKVLMFNKILNKYTSEPGYPEYISRRLLTSLQELPLTPSLLCFLWSASHNVKEGDMCPFATSPHLKPLFPFLSYECNEICGKLTSPGICPLSLFPFSPSPTRCPSLPQHSPFALFHLLWAILSLKSGIWVIYEYIWSRLYLHAPPNSSGRPGVSRTSSWGSHGGYLVFEAICLGINKKIKKTPVWEVEKHRGWLESQQGKVWGRVTDFYTH